MRRTGFFRWFSPTFPLLSAFPAISAILAVSASLAPGLAEAGAPVEKVLGNGLKVIVQEDHRAPVVVQQIWYRVGSIDEVGGKTGLAHVFEHMMFKGTRDVPAGEFSARIAAAGGRENAFTSNDFTAYFQQLHKSRLALAMELEADRMQNLIVSEAEFKKEVQVVMEERRMRTDDEPHARLHEELMATMFREHPYHHPVIGWMADLEALTAKDVQDWHTKWYDPGNAVLVVVGDVQAEEVFKLAQRHYGKIPGHVDPHQRDFAEPAQTAIRRITVKAPAELPRLLMAWRAPVLRDPAQDWKPYALEVLAGVLNGNGAARLDKALIREQHLASAINVDYDTLARGPGVFILDGTVARGKRTAQLEAGLRAQLASVVKKGISEEELKRVKAQLTAAEVFKLDSTFYQGMQIGQMESVGLSSRDLPLLLKKLQAVTARQVQDIAREIFHDDALTVAVLDPQPLTGKPVHMMPQGGHNVR